ncbi:MAG: leucine-rich repeat protein [Blautia sp.]
MKKRLRLLAWMLTLTMLCELLPFGAFAQSDVGQQLALAAAQSLEEENGEATIIGKCGDNLQWSLSSDGVLTIDGTGKMFDYNSVPPYNISPWYHNTNITTLIVKEGVTSIGDYAFLGCYKISNISFPNSLTSIGYSAFDPCSGLTEITLPENLIYLGGYSLTSGNFSSISIPIGITSIEKYTFANCKKLKSVSLPDTLTSIGEGTFNQCTSLDSFNIPKNVVDIGRYAFWNCTSLKHIEIPSGIPQINEGTFDNCSSLKSISIPSSVVSIGESAFYGCNSLEDVYFSGTQSQWENISVANYQNTALENATIHYQSTGPEDEKEFTFGRDNLSFLNHSDYFFKRSNPIMSSFFDFIVKPNYINATLALSDEKFDLLTKNYVPRVKTVLDLCRSSSWGGSCLGMTDVAAIHYISPYKLPFSAATTYDLAAPVNDKSVQDLINYYQILQYSPTLRKVAIDRVVFCGDNFDEAISEIVTSLNTGYPVLALIASEGHSSHFILLLNIQEETHEYYAIRVYDPNQSKEKILYLHKFFSEKIGQLPISYESCDVTYNRINYYLLCKNDLQFLDLRNFYGIGDNETATDYDGNFVIVNSDYSLSLKWGRAYYRASNGKLVEYSDDITVIPDGSTMADGTYAGNLWISVPTPTDGSDFTLETSSSDTGLTSLLLNDTLLSISTSGPVELTYNEADRTVDVTAEAPTDVNLLMTKNDVNESWPWHSWALDTTGTTTLHADLDDDGLHLSGDGITNAKYATENADTENVDSGTISVQPDADGITTVTITNKKSSSGDSLEIVTPSAPTTGNAITITNGFAYIDDPEQPVNSAALGDVVTIVANDRSSEGKTFTGWVMNSGDVTLNDSSASPTSFTMGDKAVSITAQYSTNSTPIPTPGGGSSSGGSGGGGGGGGGGGAAVLIGVGAAASITAGVIMMSPVDVKGRVVLADQAAVPGAKLSLLHEGKVVAQTTADENGSFAFKAKRGSYELTAAYTTADGQLIYKTIDIKAPAKDLTVTF